MEPRTTDSPLSRRAFAARVAAAASAFAWTGDPSAARRIVPRAQRVIFLFMAGGPSQLDLLDYKPELRARAGQLMPESLTRGQRLAQLRDRELIIVGSGFRFRRSGQAGGWFSELLPHTARIADRIAVVRSMHTEAVNHDPGMTKLQTGFEQPGRPSIGAWVSFALGSANPSLPPFVVLISGAESGAQPLYARLWGAGFLPGQHQGVRMRAGVADPVLFLRDPPGVDRRGRRALLEAVKALNARALEATGDAEVRTRDLAYEMASRLQESVPELMDLRREPRSVLDLYGAEPGRPSFALNCLIARRLAERGVRFVQLYHRDWDHHENLPARLTTRCRQTDQAAAALVLDLERRGLLDDTLVVWGGEFGRSPMNQGDMSDGNYGRDHHGKAFAMWLAGGGVKPGIVWGETDELGYAPVRHPVHVHDLHATMLHCLGLDHEQLTWRHEGRDFRLTDVAGRVVRGLLR